ncbi:hypothetical protein FA95DRAFT_1556866 [Auriscalpium vulgare]|uniref:Uncharacterized protein n=1 Tax=Auriscalpium vulgare TaxID=40419 RepID=A0ACB8RYZ3_9AGAM|nr:hypothetical protein FA95DRAFT_1556866 [Auriscalpium vulgare]
MVHSTTFAVLLALCLCATSSLAVPLLPTVPAAPAAAAAPAAPALSDFSFSPPSPPSPPSPRDVVPHTPDMGAAFQAVRRKQDDVKNVAVGDIPKPIAPDTPIASATEHTYKDSKRAGTTDDTTSTVKIPLGTANYHHNAKPQRRNTLDPVADPGKPPVQVAYQHHNERADVALPESPSVDLLHVGIPIRRDGVDTPAVKGTRLSSRDDGPPPPPPPPKTDIALPSDEKQVDVLHMGRRLPAAEQVNGPSRRQGPPGPPPPPPPPKTNVALPGDATFDAAHFQSRQGPPPPPPPPKTSIQMPEGSKVDALHVGSRDSEVEVPTGGPVDAASIN